MTTNKRQTKNRHSISIATLALVVLALETEASETPLNKLPHLRRGSSWARGWGDNIKWYRLREGMRHARQTGRPAMVVIHKTASENTRRLAPQFAASEAARDLSNEFVMINVHDAEEPHEGELALQLSPDGAYFPRVLFIDPSGKVRDDIHNTFGHERVYNHYYGTLDELLAGMRDAIERFKPPTLALPGNDEL
ncbi:thioredoxin domain-containing protein [Capsaspora owczarzaki ATCC 30864]|uniref:Thioredoxin domain-containing protein n=1 Tax=Capsaspora owczarzaki (strain ATCC 30864) TaxID=595528 RepID=A0A0D2WGI4_CAPO3|nr:thioredoxin domain-containing protein [Capsaspora owczarzaki ATCC 30864]KJE88525.1 thioredoxin domain-containing protein [Capsaspora owczarzaki ATCC 30864]|eukprot:XP_004365042.1 thioredoxin domain-containing protein [Capsaspora owczarzaki ATCC 30864]